LFSVSQRGKKRRWKEAYHASADEVTALHTQLLAKHKDLEALEAHLNQLHMELMLLGIHTAAERQQQRPLSGASGNPTYVVLNCTRPIPSSVTSACAHGVRMSGSKYVHPMPKTSLAAHSTQCKV
jgi:hypothetical protein